MKTMELNQVCWITCILFFADLFTVLCNQEVSTVSELTFNTSDSTVAENVDICPSVLLEDQIRWRTVKQIVNVDLNSAWAYCSFGTNCSAELPHQSVDRIFSVDIQNGDKIRLNIYIDEEGTSSLLNVTAVEIPLNVTFSCADFTDSEYLWDVIQDFSLNEEWLKPGNHSFIVKYSNVETGCALTWTLRISVQDQSCSKNRDSPMCSRMGTCANQKNSASFSCHCCPGYIGRYCEEKDACYQNPCQHSGFCVDIAEGLSGSTFQCLCPHGYRGRACESEVSLCDKRPCLNNGSCHGNQTHYTCMCPRGFTGSDCEINVNECLSNPCIHGVCEDVIGGYKCYCLPGYGGDHCEFEYDECDSSPCINGGACEDLVAGYRCHCGPGYKGRRCQIKVDLCQPNPCPSPAQCVDRGNNYSCVCHPGFNGPGCTQRYDPCFPNPCRNGGSCWPSFDSYFCSCRQGYTGDLCETSLHHPSQPLPRTLEDPGEPEDENFRKSDRGNSDTPIDHWHNLYLAGTMLTLAITVVALVAVVCHCRIHKTYLTFTRRLSRPCLNSTSQKPEEQGKFSLNHHGSVSEAPLEGGYEASNVDVVESLNAPLIV